MYAVALGRIALPGGIPDLGEIVANLAVIAFVAAAIFFFIQIVIAGIAYINAGGDPKSMEAARNRITSAMIGLGIVVGAFAITVIVTTILGINIFTGLAITII